MTTASRRIPAPRLVVRILMAVSGGRSSILLEFSGDNAAKMSQFISAARGLAGAQQAARRVRAGILALEGKLAGQKKSLDKVIAQQQALLAQLTPAQQVGTSPGHGWQHWPHELQGTDKTQAEKAVAFAYAQLGNPYVWGATGPGSYDCSGLTMASRAAAGYPFLGSVTTRSASSRRFRAALSSRAARTGWCSAARAAIPSSRPPGGGSGRRSAPGR